MIIGYCQIKSGFLYCLFFCHVNSEFIPQFTGIFSNELLLGGKNVYFLMFLLVAENQSFANLRRVFVNQKPCFFIKKSMFLGFHNISS